MDYHYEDKLLVLELQTIFDETVKRYDSVLNDDYQPRRVFALAQVAAVRDLAGYLAENVEDEGFGEVLEATLEGQESRYFQAFKDDDRQVMNIALAHRRILNRLIRRLTDPRRRQSLLPQLGLRP